MEWHHHWLNWIGVERPAICETWNAALTECIESRATQHFHAKPETKLAILCCWQGIYSKLSYTGPCDLFSGPEIDSFLARADWLARLISWLLVCYCLVLMFFLARCLFCNLKDISWQPDSMFLKYPGRTSCYERCSGQSVVCGSFLSTHGTHGTHQTLLGFVG